MTFRNQKQVFRQTVLYHPTAETVATPTLEYTQQYDVLCTLLHPDLQYVSDYSTITRSCTPPDFNAVAGLVYLPVKPAMVLITGVTVSDSSDSIP